MNNKNHVYYITEELIKKSMFLEAAINLYVPQKKKSINLASSGFDDDVMTWVLDWLKYKHNFRYHLYWANKLLSCLIEKDELNREKYFISLRACADYLLIDCLPTFLYILLCFENNYTRIPNQDTTILLLSKLFDWLESYEEDTILQLSLACKRRLIALAELFAPKESRKSDLEKLRSYVNIDEDLL